MTGPGPKCVRPPTPPAVADAGVRANGCRLCRVRAMVAAAKVPVGITTRAYDTVPGALLGTSRSLGELRKVVIWVIWLYGCPAPT